MKEEYLQKTPRQQYVLAKDWASANIKDDRTQASLSGARGFRITDVNSNKTYLHTHATRLVLKSLQDAVVPCSRTNHPIITAV